MSLGKMHWQCSQDEASYNKQKQGNKAGERSPRNAKTTGNRKVNKDRHGESVGRDMLRKVFQVAKGNEFQNIIFCDGFLIGFCFLTQHLFICKISIDENLRTYGRWDI